MSDKRLFKMCRDDFSNCHAWKVNLSNLSVQPIAIHDLTEDEPVISLTEFILSDGTIMDGFCFAYDETGFAVFGQDGESFEICSSHRCSTEEVAQVKYKIGKDESQIFPIFYRLMIKVFGREVLGSIDVGGPNP
ncbi:MAG: hypothetical protein P9F75_16515 [Candidatus Contendobacter sp.]|nr:hypothetical protein [Candidatus Contendobacter sp.]